MRQTKVEIFLFFNLLKNDSISAPKKKKKKLNREKELFNYCKTAFLLQYLSHNSILMCLTVNPVKLND